MIRLNSTDIDGFVSLDLNFTGGFACHVHDISNLLPLSSLLRHQSADPGLTENPRCDQAAIELRSEMVSVHLNCHFLQLVQLPMNSFGVFHRLPRNLALLT